MTSKIWLRTEAAGSSYTGLEASLLQCVDDFKKGDAKDVLEAKPGRVQLFLVLHSGLLPTQEEDELALRGRPLDPPVSLASAGVTSGSFLIASISCLSPPGA